ncbi:MAG: serine/threonine protein kinase [Planctomycetales bacterium]|nr:serine/threonine protein kinase [Planctomycetales bacterium]
MNPNLPDEEYLFGAALDLPAGAPRQEYLMQACGGNRDLRESVEELLRLHDTADGFLEPLLDRPDLDEHDVEIGATVGRYELLEQIGAGGFGVVYRALQREPVKREVAVKIVKLGMDTREVLERFAAERQALAMMQHPNVAGVLDAGTTEKGRPYFVMELVAGLPIDRFCDEHQLEVCDRLQLMLAVCDAIQHAHQKGIVHRDLKPTNILVTTQDGRPIPKVIDFGIAKVLGQCTTASITRQDQLVGTPEYMSPEQMTGGCDVDTRTDIFGLGGVLYKLLAGTGPYLHRPEQAVRLGQAVAHTVEVIAPSSRIVKLPIEHFREIAGDRRREPASLRRQLRGELDWIVLKALHVDRDCRYQTVIQFADDLRRFQRQEPVLAGPPRISYRVRKLVRRHAWSIVGVSLVTFAIVGGGAAAVVGLIRAEHERKRAELGWAKAELQRQNAVEQSEKARQAMELLQNMLGATHASNGHAADYTLRQMLDDFSEKLDDAMAPEIEAELRWTIGRAYRSLGALPKSLPHVRRSLELNRQLYGRHGLPSLRCQVEYAMLLYFDADFEGARQLAEEVLDHLPADGMEAELRVEALEVLIGYHSAWHDQAQVEAIASEGLLVAERELGTQHPAVSRLQLRLAHAQFQLGKDDEARESSDRAWTLINQLYGQDHLERAFALRLRGLIAHRSGDSPSGEEMVRDSLAMTRRQVGDHSCYVVACLITLAQILGEQRKTDEAIVLATEAVETAESVTMDRQMLRLKGYRQLASLVELRDPAAAIQYWELAIGVQKETFPSAPELVRLLHRLSGAWQCVPDDERAVAVLYQALDEMPSVVTLEAETQRGKGGRDRDMFSDAASPDAPSRTFRTLALVVRLDLVDALCNLGELNEAGEVLDELDKLKQTTPSSLCDACCDLAEARVSLTYGSLDDAMRLVDSASTRLQPRRQRRFWLRSQLVRADILMGQGDFDAAEPLLLRMARSMWRRGELWGRPQHLIRQRMVRLFEAQGRSTQAKRWRTRRVGDRE